MDKRGGVAARRKAILGRGLLSDGLSIFVEEVVQDCSNAREWLKNVAVHEKGFCVG